MIDSVKTLLDTIQPPPAVAIADLVRKLEREGQKIAKLQTGEPCFFTPSYIKEALVNALTQNKTHYCASQGILELRQTISNWYKNDFNTEIASENILITQGAVGGIYCTVTALLNVDDEVILIDPAWPQYENIVKLNSGKTVRISTRKNKGRLLVSDIENAITEKTRLIIINNPSNPSGIVYNEMEVNSFISVAARHNIYILFDEVYNRIVFSEGFKSVLNCGEFKNHKDRIIYINSLSKTFAMTGWRVGYAFMNESLLKKSLLVSQNILTNISTFSQFAAIEAIEKFRENENEFVAMNALYSKRNKELKDLLLGKNIDFMMPEGAFYLFIKIGMDSVSFAEHLLLNEKIAVVPGNSYGSDFNDYIRISFAVDNYSYDRFVEWLKQYNYSVN